MLVYTTQASAVMDCNSWYSAIVNSGDTGNHSIYAQATDYPLPYTAGEGRQLMLSVSKPGNQLFIESNVQTGVFISVLV